VGADDRSIAVDRGKGADKDVWGPDAVRVTMAALGLTGGRDVTGRDGPGSIWVDAK
jgi:hypothetical protein